MFSVSDLSLGPGDLDKRMGPVDGVLEPTHTEIDPYTGTHSGKRRDL